MNEAKDSVVLRRLGIETKISCHQIVNSKLATVTEEIQWQWFFFQCPFFPLYQLSGLMKPIFLCHFLFSFFFHFLMGKSLHVTSK